MLSGGKRKTGGELTFPGRHFAKNGIPGKETDEGRDHSNSQGCSCNGIRAREKNRVEEGGGGGGGGGGEGGGGGFGGGGVEKKEQVMVSRGEAPAVGPTPKGSPDYLKKKQIQKALRETEIEGAQLLKSDIRKKPGPRENEKEGEQTFQEGRATPRKLLLFANGEPVQRRSATHQWGGTRQ